MPRTESRMYIIYNTLRYCDATLGRRVIAIYALLTVVNLAVWAWAFYAFYGRPAMLGTVLLAYSFGLRHAVDADHIAAIDNVIRKLMHEGKRPVAVGFWFSLGHSAVVVLAAIALAITVTQASSRFDWLKGAGGIAGTLVSTSFLFAIAAMNIVILIGIWKRFQDVRRGGTFDNQDLDLMLNDRGLLSRLLRPLFRLVTQSWHMLPLGFLFGLGFETATEVAILGISAIELQRGMSIWLIMIFPALFAAGMSLIDTTDGILMLGAYNWAFVKPMRKLYYNLVITAVAVVVALLIGGIEGFRLLGDQFGLEGPFWSGLDALNFNALGFAIIGVFVLAWLASMVIYRYARIDHLELRVIKR
jgi:nickel/cobalt transporter (NiCoT) family protein